MELDTPPLYSILHPKLSVNSFVLILDKITLRLEKLLLDKTTSNENKISHYFLDAEQMLPQTFIESTLNTWQYVKGRTQRRDKTHGILSVCLGISACHWFISEHLSVSEGVGETTYDL
ncbi:MAG TPA: hypothetical protein PLD88_12815, partial [Candidatus Berkiella sp.]|nr:hypothetical protein [Candidatus Berkiella sp.]